MMTHIRAGLRGRLAVLRRLQPPRDYLLFLRIFGFALVAPWLMRLPMAQVTRLLTPTQPATSPDPLRVEQIILYTNVILRACRPLVQERCLTRGLTLYHFLRRSGLEVDLHFGAGYVDHAFAAHCWLVKDGEPYAEQPDPRLRYQTMFVMPVVAAMPPTQDRYTGTAIDPPLH